MADVSAQHIPHHRLSVQATLGALSIDVDLLLYANWVLLFGPSGSSKSSLLRAACGLLPSATIHFARHQSETWQDLTNTSPAQRSIGWAPQHSSLFPHLTVRDNIDFAHRSHPTHAENLTPEALRLLRLDHLAHRLPRELSGGERQRVNLARAYARPGCRLMLLDEPFAGIDRPLRDEILPELRSALRARGIPVLSVSHDVEEAFLLQCEVVLLRDGRIEDQGYVSKVLRPERDRLLQTLAKN